LISLSTLLSNWSARYISKTAYAAGVDCVRLSIIIYPHSYFPQGDYMARENIIWWADDSERIFTASLTDPKQRLAWEMLSGVVPVVYNRTPELRKLVVDKAGLKTGERLLLIGEDLVNCGLSAAFRKVVGKKGVVDEVETSNEWRCGKKLPLISDATKGKTNDSYDAAVVTGLHHVSDLKSEVTNLAGVVRGGGRVVLVAHGPRRSTFALAAGDGYLSVLAERVFRGAATSIFPDMAEDEAYARMQEVFETPASLVVDAAGGCLDSVNRFEAAGFLIVDGAVRPGSQW